MVSVPSGWPHGLPPPQSEEFEERVCGWLLDRGPAELRTGPLRGQPEVLAVVVGHYLDGARQGLRTAYARARSELAPFLPPGGLTEVLSALELQGAHLVQVQREVTLVREVLLTRPRPRGARAGEIA